MRTVSDIYQLIAGLAPFEYAVKGDDNVGLLVGGADAPVDRVLLSLDITNAAVAEAAGCGAQLIVSHHPVIYHPLYRIAPESPVYKLIEYHIAAICAHTNLDMAPGGLSDEMAKLLGFDSDAVLEVIHSTRYDTPIGFGKICTLQTPVSARALAERAKAVFGSTVVRYTDGGKPIHKVALCSGSGGSILPLALAQGCDAYITGDLRHEHFIDAANSGLTLIDAGHYHTEMIFADYLRGKILAAFPELAVQIAQTSTDPVEYVQ